VVGYVLGVDIGTTYTAAAVARDGRLELVTLGLRASEMPSVAFLRDDGTMLFGEPAERRGVNEPTRLAREFKRRLGDPTPVILGSAPMSAHALVGRLLADVVATVTEREGGPADGVVVTRPANWGPYKAELFAQALDAAGIGPAATITENEAATAFYAATRDIADGEMLAVYDLGGGTFDATIVRRTGDSFAVVREPTGIEHLGGWTSTRRCSSTPATRSGTQWRRSTPTIPPRRPPSPGCGGTASRRRRRCRRTPRSRSR
jgi:molecular chaperone DnaK